MSFEQYLDLTMPVRDAILESLSELIELTSGESRKQQK
jgi:hypothetical protein